MTKQRLSALSVSPCESVLPSPHCSILADVDRSASFTASRLTVRAEIPSPPRTAWRVIPTGSCHRPWRSVDRRFRDRHQREQRAERRRHVQGRHRRDELPDRHLPTWILRRPGRTEGRVAPAFGAASAGAAGLRDGCHDRVWTTAAPGRPRPRGAPPERFPESTWRNSCAPTRASPVPARATWSSSSATTPGTRTCCSRRPTRRGRRTTSLAARVCTAPIRWGRPGAVVQYGIELLLHDARGEGQLQPSVRHARPRSERWVLETEYPMVRWLEATATT